MTNVWFLPLSYKKSMIMTKSRQMACGTVRRMNGHVKRMYLQLHTKIAATLLSLMLMMVFDSTKLVAASRNQECEHVLQSTLKLARFVQKESTDTIKTYKASQGDLSELICRVTLSGLPDPNISGLEPSERISSIYNGLQEFSPHFRRVQDQQTDLQLPDSEPLKQLDRIITLNDYLGDSIGSVYQDLFPNSPRLVPDPSVTSLPSPQNVFQQKVYGCVVLRTYKEFLSNISKYLRTLRNQRCGINYKRRVNNAIF